MPHTTQPTSSNHDMFYFANTLALVLMINIIRIMYGHLILHDYKSYHESNIVVVRAQQVLALKLAIASLNSMCHKSINIGMLAFIFTSKFWYHISCDQSSHVRTKNE